MAISGNGRRRPVVNTPEILTLTEVASLLRIGERTAYELARRGRIPAAKVGGQWRTRRTDIDAWLSRGGEVPTGEGGLESSHERELRGSLR
jgi:excisionase family DNA binding protein